MDRNSQDMSRNSQNMDRNSGIVNRNSGILDRNSGIMDRNSGIFEDDNRNTDRSSHYTDRSSRLTDRSSQLIDLDDIDRPMDRNKNSDISYSATCYSDRDRRPPPNDIKPWGVMRAEACALHFTKYNRYSLFFSILLVAFAYGFDSTIRFALVPEAASSLNAHAQISTINVVKGVISVVAQPCAAKLADIFGRNEVYIASVFFYILGSIVEANAKNIATLAAGSVLWQLGYTVVVLLLDIIIADFTTLRARVLFSYIPPFCYLIIPWVGGKISAAIMGHLGWKWGIGIFAMVYFVCALPLMFTLWWVDHKAKKAGVWVTLNKPYIRMRRKALAKFTFWQLDVIGLFLLTIILGCTFTPLTLAGGKDPTTHWGELKTILPIVIGLLAIPLFLWWEKTASIPLAPYKLLQDRAIWAALGIGLFFNFAWACQSDYLYTVLIVAFNESVESATIITNLYSFVSVLTGIAIGAVVYKIRRLKPIIIFGCCLYFVAFGMLIKFRGGLGKGNHSGIIATQIVLGIGGGLFPYPTLTSIQAATKHERTAVMTALYFAMYNVGSTLGNAVSGAVWTQTAYGKLESQFGGSSTAASNWYHDMLGQAKLHPVGTPERDAAIEVMKHIQRLLCIAGFCICAVLILFACFLRNYKLPDTQSMEDAEERNVEILPLEESRGFRSLFKKGTYF